jgi:hypothetical protein
MGSRADARDPTQQAGEDLDEDDDEDSEDEAEGQSYTSPGDGSAGGVVRRALSRGPSALPQHMVNERAPLLGEGSRANSKTRVGRRSVQGDATVMQAVLMVRDIISLWEGLLTSVSSC